MPAAGLDTQRLVADLADVAGIARAIGFRPPASNVDVAPFKFERLLVELIERFRQRPDVNARPHSMRSVGIE